MHLPSSRCICYTRAGRASSHDKVSTAALPLFVLLLVQRVAGAGDGIHPHRRGTSGTGRGRRRPRQSTKAQSQISARRPPAAIPRRGAGVDPPGTGSGSRRNRYGSAPALCPSSLGGRSLGGRGGGGRGGGGRGGGGRGGGGRDVALVRLDAVLADRADAALCEPARGAVRVEDVKTRQRHHLLADAERLEARGTRRPRCCWRRPSSARTRGSEASRPRRARLASEHHAGGQPSAGRPSRARGRRRGSPGPPRAEPPAASPMTSGSTRAAASIAASP